MRETLKQATREAHLQAEAVWMGDAGFEALEDYRAWLHALKRAHAHLGLAAARQVRNPSFVTLEQDRLSALAGDLGQRIKPEQIEPTLLTESQAWGVLYALNGSALGGSVLLKAGHTAPDWPTAYLQTMQAYARSGALAQFFRNLEAVDIVHSEAVSGAKLVFWLLKNQRRVLQAA
jgi:heme oxygenase